MKANSGSNGLKRLIELTGTRLRCFNTVLADLPQPAKLTHLTLCLQVALIGMFISGCLLKPATVSTRHFVLAPISTNEPASGATKNLSVGVGPVKMPSYLLANSMAVRNGSNEIAYLENARWAERLDQCLQRTLAANLSRLLSTDRIYVADWGHDQVMVKLLINVQQFDVDSQGRGTLVAYWQIIAPKSELPLKSGCARLDQTGAAPHGNPEVIATTLSNLAAELSRQMAQAIRDAPMTRPDISNVNVER